MISDALLAILFALLQAILDVLAAAIPAPPSWLAAGLNQVPFIYELVMDFDTWLPVNTMLLAVGWILSVNVAVVLLKLVRIGISYFTFGGGAVSE